MAGVMGWGGVGWQSVYISFSFITLLNAIFAAFCLVLFRPATCDSTDGSGSTTPGVCPNVLHNLGGVLARVIKMLLSIDLLFTIPVILAAAREIIEESLGK